MKGFLVEYNKREVPNKDIFVGGKNIQKRIRYPTLLFGTLDYTTKPRSSKNCAVISNKFPHTMVNT